MFLSALHRQNRPERSEVMSFPTEVWDWVAFHWMSSTATKPRAFSTVLAIAAVLLFGAPSTFATNLSFTSPPVRLRPGETAFRIQIPGFDPNTQPNSPVLHRIDVSINASFSAGIRLADPVRTNTPISFSLGPGVVSVRPSDTNPLTPSPVFLTLQGTNGPDLGITVPRTAQVEGSQTITSTNPANLAYFMGANSPVFDIDFLALYPPIIKTDRLSATGLFYDDAVVVSLVVQYLSSPILTVLGPPHFVYDGRPQGPTNYTLFGTQELVSFSYQGVNGTDYGPAQQAPTRVGTYTAIASINADGTHSSATSEPLLFWISPAPLTVTANAEQKPYGTTLLLSELTHGFSATGLRGSDRITTVTPKYNDGLKAGASQGDYVLNIENAAGPNFDAQNYHITYLPGILTVTQPIPKVVSTGGAKGVVVIRPMTPAAPGAPALGTSMEPVGNTTNGTIASVMESNISAGTLEPSADVPLMPGWALMSLLVLVGAVGSGRIRPTVASLTLGCLFVTVSWSAMAERTGDEPVAPVSSSVRLGKMALIQCPTGRQIQWTMATEFGVVGYDVLRPENGRWSPINSGLIVAHPRSDHTPYLVTEGMASAGDHLTCRLIARLNSGSRMEVAEQALTITEQAESADLPTPVQRNALFKPEVVAIPVGPPIPVDLPNSPAGVKIMTSSRGVHFVSASSIASVLGQSDPGVVSAWLNQGRLALFNGGFDAAHRVDYIPAAGYGIGGLVPGLYFYAEQIWNNYTTTNAYWLLAGTNQYSVVDGGNPLPVAPAAYTAMWSAKSDIDNGLSTVTVSQGSPQGVVSDQPFWFWKQLTASSGNDTWNTSFSLDHLSRGAGEMASLTIDIYGSTQTAQLMTVRLNGATLDSKVQGGGLGWSGTGPRQIQFLFPMTLLKDSGVSPTEGKNTLSVQALLPSGAFVSQFYLDSYQLSYQRRFAIGSAFAPSLEFQANVSTAKTVSINGFGGAVRPPIMALDVTDVRHPGLVSGVSITGASGAWTASLNSTSSTNRFVVFNPSVSGAQFIPPSSALSLAYPAHLDDPSIQASYLIVTHSLLTNSANALAAYRSQLFRTKVVVIDDIYNQFSYGMATPHALEAFVRSAYTNWSIPPRYLVLVGDGSYDYRDLTASHDFFVPPLMMATPYGAFASDSHYGSVVDDGLPRVIVGRFPIRSDAEFTTMLNKIKTYETESVTNLKALLLADQPDAAGNFIAHRNALGTALGDRYLGSNLDPGYSPPLTPAKAVAIQAAVRTSLNGGVDLFNYIGHGAQDQLGVLPYVQVATQSPVNVSPTFNNPARLPILVAMTCVAGDFAQPGFTSLAEAMLRVNGSGAVAVVAPTGLSQDSDAFRMNLTLMTLLGANTHGRFGDLVVQAFSQYATSPPANARTTFWLYNILGDPALEVVSSVHF